MGSLRTRARPFAFPGRMPLHWIEIPRLIRLSLPFAADGGLNAPVCPIHDDFAAHGHVGILRLLWRVREHGVKGRTRHAPLRECVESKEAEHGARVANKDTARFLDDVMIPHSFSHGESHAVRADPEGRVFVNLSPLNQR